MIGAEPLGVQNDRPPDFRTQPKAFERWLQRKKLDHYHATHKEVIEWADEFIAPVEFRNTWLEIKYEAGLLFDYKKEGIEDISKEKIHAVTRQLGDILEVLFWDVGWYSPFVIQIDNHGYCHLLLCTDKNDKPKSLDMILRIGKKSIVKIGEAR